MKKKNIQKIQPDDSWEKSYHLNEFHDEPKPDLTGKYKMFFYAFWILLALILIGIFTGIIPSERF